MCTIKGFVSKPEGARKKSGQDYFFVNGRFMKHPYFHKAVISAYDRLIPEGMQIPYFLYFEVEPSEIDVNIHPTKTEIKFENEQAIWQILSASVRDAIGKFCEVPTIEFDTQGRPEIPVFDPTHDDIAAPRVQYNPDYNPFKNAGTSGSSTFSKNSRVSNTTDPA
jgi:DNA mismatch repair protein MutL